MVKKMDETHKLAALVVPITWLVAIICGLVIYFTTSTDNRSIYLNSYIIGVAVSLLNFSLTVKGARKFLKEVAKGEVAGTPVRQTVINYIIRFTLAATIFLIVAIDHNSSDPRFNIIATLGGYMTLKVVLMVVVLIKKGRLCQ